MGKVTQIVTPSVEDVINSRKSGMEYSELRFPEELGPHAIVLNFSDYNYNRSANTVSTATSSSICLPIPSNLSDTFAIRIAPVELGVMGDFVRNIAPVAMNARTFEEGFTNVINSDNMTAAAAGKAIKAAIASADSSIVKGAEVALGTIVNPHIALTFDGISLKTHTFQWQFAPTSSDESVKLANIIRKIKRDILPSYKEDVGRTFLKYPKVVDIFFLGTETGFMYYFKRCMVESFEANYSGAGTPAFLPNGRPAFVNVTMTLSEMEIHTSDDYSGTVNSALEG